MLSGNPSLQSYTVAIPVYEGPLDLLLQLIERAELDITKVALAQVTDQFLEHLREMGESTADDVSSFLIIASKLVQIKSEALLPRPPIREQGEEDPGEALARQLIIYKRFKEIANFLSSRQEKLRTYPRIAPLPLMEPSLDMSGLTIEDIFLAAEFLLSREIEALSLNSVVGAPKYTIREKIYHIAEYLKMNVQGSFSHLLDEHPSRLEVVVTFLALLELVKRNMVDAQQEGLFSEISIMPASAWADDLAFDLEFGE
jgi:segregation and condensation protein A